jgi:hypothetical protein
VAASKRLEERAAVAGRLLRIAESGSPEVREAAVRALILSSRFLAAGPARTKFDETVTGADAGKFLNVLKPLLKIDWKQVQDEQARQIALGVVSVGLAHSSPEVARASLEAVRSLEQIQKNQGILAAVRSLERSSDATVRDPAAALLKSLAARGQEAVKDPGEILDYQFFARRVNPLLTRAAEDGDTCAKCHANHVIFRLYRPEEVKDQEAGVRGNYLSALKVVDVAKPEQSLFLVKPLQTFEKIGIPGEYRNSHGGNVRWPKGKESEEYRAILQWIQGARLAEPPPAASAAGAGRSF